jgi:hypothetical protein
MSRHRIKITIPFFGEAEAEGLYGVIALAFVILVVLVVTHRPG